MPKTRSQGIRLEVHKTDPSNEFEEAWSRLFAPLLDDVQSQVKPQASTLGCNEEAGNGDHPK